MRIQLEQLTTENRVLKTGFILGPRKGCAAPMNTIAPVGIAFPEELVFSRMRELFVTGEPVSSEILSKEQRKKEKELEPLRGNRRFRWIIASLCEWPTSKAK
jgi:hypothetical protein